MSNKNGVYTNTDEGKKIQVLVVLAVAIKLKTKKYIHTVILSD